MGKIDNIMDKSYVATMPDGSRWAVPVKVIALDRAEFYARRDREFNGSVERSLEEETIPCFEEDPYCCADWAKGNMNWSDVEGHAVEVEREKVPPVDYQEGWVNGEWGIE